MTANVSDKRVRSELRRIKAAHQDLLEQPDAIAQMSRLARLRCRFQELSALIEADGGANAENVSLVSECRQLSRAAGAIEQSLRTWAQFQPSAQQDAMLLMNEARKAILARAAAKRQAAIEGQAAPVPERRPPPIAALLRDGGGE